MPEKEVADPMDIQSLVVVNCLVIVEAIDSILYPRNGFLPCQTEDCVDVRLLL